eukprot:TRINITY_DN1169_c1_g1_i5.p1 TRINITY_DN1169_c1_g1~~TRINITY_DN1169_c1_g1_i5.p1  ORF type:complete len:370 (+),score=69.89 TRINITY_DN1169_c1_g1_i5:132-1241(+)
MSMKHIGTLLLVITQTHACSYFAVESPEGEVLGRTMETAGTQSPPCKQDPPIAWNLVKVQKGLTIQPYCTGLPLPSWVTRYGYVGIGAPPEVRKVYDGINTEGLSVQTQTLNTAHYPTSQANGKINICFFDFAQWALSSFGTVGELKAALQNTSIVADKYPLEGGAVHWQVTDAAKNSIVVEVVDEKIAIHNNTVKVMTNDPPFKWQLWNLNNYMRFNTQWSYDSGISVQTELGQMPFEISHGTNTVGLPGDYTPPGRFVRLFFFKQFAQINTPPTSTADAITLATALINDVHIPKGVVAHNEPKGDLASDYTQWASLKTPSVPTFYYRTYDNMQWKKIVLSELDFTTSKETPVFTSSDGIVDASGSLN